MAKPISDEHALLCGMVWGLAMKHQVPLVPEFDEEGNYMDTFELTLPEGYGGEGSPTRVFLVVEPPTPFWFHRTPESMAALAEARAALSGEPTWETCTGCGNEYRYPHLCRAHMLCGICHQDVPHG